MKIKFTKLTKNAVIPTKAHATDAGFDLTATSVQIDEHGALVYGTGIAVEIPTGYVGLAFPRSSVSKFDISMANAVGVIDAGYRGEIQFKFKPQNRFSNKLGADYGIAFDVVNDGVQKIYNIGERIAQLIIMPIPEIEFEETDTLNDGERGTNGYGSTGL